ncbi:putative protein HIRA-like [Penaeus vannamei]|uniref:Uncharacterized protein n=1 Tax=Penaeus vannamei TaxID=6689 RepID=A0A423TIH0_PENVA|nr:putative protein HIRA-like [Penaeus vannamei]
MSLSSPVNSRRPAPPTPQRAPINKQIETRTADGKRRITPMFIPPAEGCRTENPNKSYEASFSSSQQEKSKIVVEKVDGVVEPNVTSRPPLAFNSNTNTSPSKEHQLLSLLNSMGFLQVCLQDLKNQLMVQKNKWMDRLQQSQPVVSSRPQAVSHTQGEPLNVLPEASLSKSARVQIPGENSTDGPPPLLIVENDYRIGNRVGMGGGTPSLHRVSRTQLNVVILPVYGESCSQNTQCCLPVIKVNIKQDLLLVSCTRLLPNDAKQNLTEVFINRMLTSAQYLRAAQDYKFWLKRKIQFFIKEGLEKKLRDVFDDLLGPRHSGSMDNQDQNGWMPKIMDFDKKSLLEEFLREILLAENSLQLQRLYSEYKEQLEGNLIDTI